MKILLLGANGRTGREIIKRALDAGDFITALVRSEDKLIDITHPHLSVYTGNVCNSSTLKEILPGHDVVISTLGPKLPTKTACAIYSDSAKAIVDAMQESDVNRLLVTSTALLYPSRTLLERIIHLIARHSAKNAGLMEASIRSSSLDWTIARMGFLNDKLSNNYIMAESSGGAISRSAVASFLLTEARESTHVHKVVGLSEK
ncbi:NAD(P)-dependent oxidoreductase [Photobacterium swingsii]|uniref:Flavin reductase n=2 Tax=Vibrio TaxID=662 RepID=A0A0H3ZR97_9VIBR|nr:Flavin reductase [Vibrio tasmaniensis]AKN40810.1 hypothetical protein [Vibrio sp. 1F_189]